MDHPDIDSALKINNMHILLQRKHHIQGIECLFLNGKEKLKFRRKFLFRVETIAKINASNSAVCMDLHAQSFNIISTVGTASEIRKIELDLIPAIIQPHRHCANEGLHTSGGLIVRGTETSAYILIIQYLHFKSEILLQIFDDHHQKGKLNAKRS